MCQYGVWNECIMNNLLQIITRPLDNIWHTVLCRLYRVSQEECAILRKGVPYVKVYRYNPKHLCPKLNRYGDNGQRKVLTSCISAYCTSSAVSALTLTEQCSSLLCGCTSSAQRDKIVLHYCQIFMRYVQCLLTLRTTMTWVRVSL